MHIERSFILRHAGPIEIMHLPSFLRYKKNNLMATELGFTSLKRVEATYLERILEKHDWNCTVTADLLGIHKTTLYRKIKSLGLHKPSRQLE